MPYCLQIASAIADLLAVLLAAAAFPFVCRQFSLQRKELRFARLSRLASLTQGYALRAAMDFVRTADRQLLRQKSLDKCKKERQRVKAVVDYLRTLATDIQYGLIPPGDAYEWVGPPTLELAQRLQPYFQDQRRKRGEEDWPSGVDWLTREFKICQLTRLNKSRKHLETYRTMPLSQLLPVDPVQTDGGAREASPLDDQAD